MAKDRAAPFSRKHRRYWIPITGGMILIGAVNLGIGFCSYEPPPPPPQKIELVIPPPSHARDAGVDALLAEPAAAAPAPGSGSGSASGAPAAPPAGAATAR